MKFVKSYLPVIIILLISFTLNCQTIAEPLSHSFTYQGKLNHNQEPVNGIFDFTFKLFDSELDGTNIGLVVNQPAITVTGGAFSAELNFGPEADIFNGQNRWLEISVRQSNTAISDFTTLQPRQPLTAVPYALYASNSGKSTDIKPKYYIEMAIDEIAGPHNGNFVFHDFTFPSTQADIVEHKVIVDGYQEEILKMPGRIVTDNQLSLTRYLSSDTTLYQWRQTVIEGDVQRCNITLSVWNDQGQMISRQRYLDCWPSKWSCQANRDKNTVDEQITIALNEVIYEPLEPAIINPEYQTPQISLPVTVEINGFPDFIEIDYFTDLFSESQIIVEKRVKEQSQIINYTIPGRLTWGNHQLCNYGPSEQYILEWFTNMINGQLERKEVRIYMNNSAGELISQIYMSDCWPAGYSMITEPETNQIIHKYTITNRDINLN